MKNKALILFLLVLFNNTSCSQTKTKNMVEIKTNIGTIKVKLYDETPLHKAHFEKMAQNGFYEGLSFHRVIKDFMIQAGELKSDNASDSLIDAEFRTPHIFHKKGALAAARMGDDMNPEKASSPSQFYIVTGEICGEGDLHAMEKQRFERMKQSIFRTLQTQNMDRIKELYKQGDRSVLSQFKDSLIEETNKEAESRKSEILFSPEQIEMYTTIGGAPYLDGEYTVFGEVVEGWDVINTIENVKTNNNDKPLKYIIIEKITIIE